MTWFWLIVGLAHADDRARELFLDGRELYNQGRYEQAIEAWDAAYQLDPRAALLLNLSNAYERLGRFEQALDFLTRYRQDAREAEIAALDERIRTLEQRVEELETQRAAEEAARRQAQAELEEERRRAAALAAEQAAREARRARVVPLVVTSAGVALAASGAVAGLSASAQRRAIRDDGLCVDGVCKLAAQDPLRAQRSGALIADVGLGVGLATAAVGAVLLVRPRPEPSAVRASIGWGRTPTLGVQGGF